MPAFIKSAKMYSKDLEKLKEVAFLAKILRLSEISVLE